MLAEDVERDFVLKPKSGYQYDPGPIVLNQLPFYAKLSLLYKSGLIFSREKISQIMRLPVQWFRNRGNDADVLGMFFGLWNNYFTNNYVGNAVKTDILI